MIGRGALAYVRHIVIASFWFIPALLVVASVGLSALTLYLDLGPFGVSSGEGSWLAIAGVQSARAILSTIATSMITVVSLVFSLMLLALTLASQQLGPRMIIHFMEDQLNQIVLGAFTATFAYALIVLRSIEDTGSSKFVPNLSINVALLLAPICLGLLIYFIHHAAMLIQSDDVVASLAAALERDVKSVFPSPASEARHVDEAAAHLLGDDSRPITADAVAMSN